MERVVVSLYATNLLDEIALTEVSAPTLPATGVALARALPGRNISASLRLFF